MLIAFRCALAVIPMWHLPYFAYSISFSTSLSLCLSHSTFPPLSHSFWTGKTDSTFRIISTVDRRRHKIDMGRACHKQLRAAKLYLSSVSAFSGQAQPPEKTTCKISASQTIHTKNLFFFHTMRIKHQNFHSVLPLRALPFLFSAIVCLIYVKRKKMKK